MPFVQSSFIFGERRTNDFTGGNREYTNSVRRLSNFRVLKNGSIKRRAGTELISELPQNLITSSDIVKAVALDDFIVLLNTQGEIYLSRGNVFKKIPILPYSTATYSIDTNSTAPLGQFNDSFGIRAGNSVSDIVVNNISLAGNKIWCFLSEELPLTISKVDLGIEVKPYFADRFSHRDYRNLIRAYPIKVEREEPKGVFFDGSPTPEEVDARVRLVVSGAADETSLDSHFCSAWFAVDEDVDSDVKKVDYRKMALGDYVNKPLFFNILPTSNILIQEPKQVESSDGVTTTENDWDNSATYTTGVLANLEDQAGLSGFSYTNPSLINREGQPVSSKTTVIKELLYGRKYMIIPRQPLYDIDPDDDGFVSYSEAYPSAEVTSTAKTNITLKNPKVLKSEATTETTVDRLSFNPNQNVSKEFGEAETSSDLEIRDLSLLGLDFDTKGDNLEVRWGVAANGGRVRTNAKDAPKRQDNYIYDNTEGRKGLYIGGKFVEIKSVWVKLEAGPRDREGDFSIYVNTVDPVFQRVPSSDLRSVTSVKFFNTDVTPSSVTISHSYSLKITVNNIPASEEFGSSTFLNGVQLWRRLVNAALDEDRDIRENLIDNVREDLIEFVNDNDLEDQRGTDFTFDIGISITGAEFSTSSATAFYGVYENTPNETYKTSTNFIQAQIGSGAKFKYNTNNRLDDEELEQSERFINFKGMIFKNIGGSTSFVLPIGDTSSSNSALQRLRKIKFITTFTNSTTQESTIIDLPSEAKTYEPGLREFVVSLSGISNFSDLYNKIGNDEVSSVAVQFYDSTSTLVRFPVRDPSPTAVTIAKGFALFPNLYLYRGEDDGTGDRITLDQNRAFSEDTKTRDVQAFGWYKKEDGNFQWFLFVNKTENPLESVNTLILTVGSSSVTVTKSTVTHPRAILFTSTDVGTEPTLNNNTSLSITAGGNTYEFAPAETSQRRSKIYALCEIYEIGMPSPAKKGDVRVIGGNDYDLKESYSEHFYSSIDLNFKDADVIGGDTVLANKDTVARVWEDAHASNPVKFLSVFSEDAQNVVRQVQHTPGNFNYLSPDVIFSYFNKSGDNLSGLLTSPQEQTIRDYLSSSIFNQNLAYTEKLEDVFGGEVEINAITPAFTGDLIYAVAKKASYSVTIGAESRHSVLSQQTSSFKPIAFNNKITYFNLNNLFVSQVYSRERLGNIEGFSGAAQTHLLTDIKNLVYDSDKNLYFLLSGNDKFITATDFDTSIEGFSRVEFGNTVEGTKIISPTHLFKGDKDVLFVANYIDYVEGNEVNKLGIFKFDYDLGIDAKGVDFISDEGEVKDGFKITSYLESHPYIGSETAQSLFILNKITLNSAWLNADNLEKSSAFIGTITNAEAIKWHEYTRVNEINPGEKIILPIPIRASMGYNTRIAVRQEDANVDTIYHGFVIGGDFAR